MKVWVVTADDHDYDFISQWCVGVFTSKRKATAAKNADRKEYIGPAKKGRGPNYSVREVELDCRLDPNE